MKKSKNPVPSKTAGNLPSGKPVIGEPVKTTEISLSDPPFDYEDYADKEFPERPINLVGHDKGYFAYLHIPNIYFYKNPQAWEISLKYEGETVKITGGPDDVLCRNACNENSDIFLRFVACLAYDGDSVVQPQAADGCPPKKGIA